MTHSQVKTEYSIHTYNLNLLANQSWRIGELQVQWEIVLQNYWSGDWKMIPILNSGFHLPAETWGIHTHNHDTDTQAWTISEIFHKFVYEDIHHTINSLKHLNHQHASSLSGCLQNFLINHQLSLNWWFT